MRKRRGAGNHFKKKQRFEDEIQQELRAQGDNQTEEQLAFDVALQEFEHFDMEATVKIKSLLGMQADTISATVLGTGPTERNPDSRAAHKRRSRSISPVV